MYVSYGILPAARYFLLIFYFRVLVNIFSLPLVTVATMASVAASVIAIIGIQSTLCQKKTRFFENESLNWRLSSTESGMSLGLLSNSTLLIHSSTLLYQVLEKYFATKAEPMIPTIPSSVPFNFYFPPRVQGPQ